MDINQVLNNYFGSSFNFNKIKKYLIIAAGLMIFILALFIVLLVLFFSHILNFVTAYVPLISEFIFTYSKDFYMGYFKEDLNAIIAPYLEGFNGQELKSIIENYIQKVMNNQNFSLENLNSFISEIQKILSDGKITPQELETARGFVK